MHKKNKFDIPNYDNLVWSVEKPLHHFLFVQQIDTPSNTDSDEEKYESTGQMFDRDLLSPRAREMCKDSKVVWMAKANGKYV